MPSPFRRAMKWALSGSGVGDDVDFKAERGELRFQVCRPFLASLPGGLLVSIRMISCSSVAVVVWFGRPLWDSKEKRAMEIGKSRIFFRGDAGRRLSDGGRARQGGPGVATGPCFR